MLYLCLRDVAGVKDLSNCKADSVGISTSFFPSFPKLLEKNHNFQFRSTYQIQRDKDKLHYVTPHI